MHAGVTRPEGHDPGPRRRGLAVLGVLWANGDTWLQVDDVVITPL